MNRISLGRLLYAIAIVVLGIEHLITGNFPVALLPIPAALPGRLVLVYSTGAILIAAGLCIAAKKKAGLAAVVLGALLLLFVLYPHLPRLITSPYNGGEWTVFFELLALSSGAFLIAGRFPFDFPNRQQYPHRLITYGRLPFALSSLVFGIQHFIYAAYVATLIPAWIPGRLFWTYFVGVAFIATAVSLLTSKQASLATSLLGIMFLLWVMLLHGPRVIAHPHAEPEWTSACIALAMSGISFTLTGLAAKNR